ncbi:cell division protein FtsL [beta proteobacterium AAP51]|nr:cell division protein FtsL [beta proteobacterium AAP51]
MKLNLLLIPVLVLALLASCLLLVKTSYESRQVFAQLDAARAEQRQLDAEFRRLDAEAQAQGTHLRVERTAREKLQMRTATPAVTAYVVDAQASGAAPAAGARATGSVR